MSNEPLPADDTSQESRRAESLADQIDEICDRFEAAWRSGQEPRIEEFLGHLAGDMPAERQLLIELIRTDLHWQWERVARQRGAAPQATETLDSDGGLPPSGQAAAELLRLEDYVARFPLLGPADELPVDLIAAEYRERRNAGDGPDPTEYQRRFPRQRAALIEELARIDARFAAADMRPPAGPAVGTRVRYFGDYELLEEIARGGMGVVYKARQQSLNRIVALKMILAGQLAGEEEVRRFHAEAEAAANLDHPGIVPIYEVGEHEGQHFFSMGYVEGESLAKQLADGPLPPREAARLMAEVAEAVAYAHSRGVIHRDLKPANILLSVVSRPSSVAGSPAARTTDHGQRTTDVVPKITDFGLAKRVTGESGLTATGQVLGTPSYMPPEQAAGKLDEIKETADVYSLGATLYALLTGRPPFQADNPLDTLLQVLHAEPVALRQLNAKLPRDLETICQKCLQKEPRRRYATAQEFADELRRCLDGKPIHARPIGRAARTWRWCKRNPVVSAMSLALLLALVSGTVISSYFAIKAGGERDRADENAGRAIEKAAELDANLYAHRIALAHQEWLARDVARARQILDACPTDLRHWEWDYLNRICHLELATFSGHQGPLIAAACSADGKRVTSLAREGMKWDADTTVRVWDANSAKELRTLGAGKHKLRCLALTRDGKYLAAASDSAPDGEDAIVVWRNDTGEELLRFGPFALMGTPNTLAFSPDGKQMASGHGRGVFVWDLPALDASRPAAANDPDESGNWKALRRFDQGERESLCVDTDSSTSVAFSPDGNRLAVAAERYGKDPSHHVTIYDVRTGNPTLALAKPSDRVNQLAYRPDGRQLALAGDDGVVRLYDTNSGREILALRGHGDSVQCVAYAPDSSLIASGGGSYDKTVRLWNVHSGEESLTLRGHGECIRSVEFSADGTRIVSASADGTAKVWSTSLGQVVRVLSGHREVVSAVAFSPRGDQFASADWEGTIKTWDAKNGQERLSLCGHSTGVLEDPTGKLLSGLAYDRDGARLVSVCADQTIKVWDTASGQVLDRLRRRTAQPGFTYAQVAFTHDGQRLVVGGGAKDAGWVWDLESGKMVLQLPGHDDLGRVSVSPDGSRIATGSHEGTVRVWDAATGDQISTLSGHREAVRTVVFSPDGTRLCSTSADGTAMIWNVATRTPELTLRGHAGPVVAAAYSPDGIRVATTGGDGTVRIWDTERGLEMFALRGPAQGGVAFSLDGQQIIAGSEKTVRAWDSGKPRLPQETGGTALGHGGQAQKAAGAAVASRREPKYEGKGMSYWVTRTKDESQDVRLEAVAALESIGPSGMPTLAELARDNDEAVSKRATLVLGAMGTRAVPLLIRLLRDDNLSVRARAAEALGSMGSEAGTVVPALAELLQDTSPEVRYGAAVGLGNMGREARAAIPALTQLLRDPEADNRRLALRALGSIGPEAVPALATLVRDEQTANQIREESAFALLEIGTAAIPYLTGLLLKENRIDETGAKALAEETAAVVPVLVRLQGGSEPLVNVAAWIALRRLGPATLNDLLAGQDPAMRDAASNALRNLRQIDEKLEELRRIELTPPTPQNTAMANLRQLGLALHNYHDKYRALPASAGSQKPGQPPVSWRVLVLPYLEERSLYRQYRFDESWDSESNKKLIAQMPKVFKAPASKVATQGKTNYLAVTGDEYAIDREKGRAFAEFTDGLPNTILVVEAGDERAVPWTKPDDLTVDEKQPAAGLTLRPNGFLAAFGDTGVRLIPMEIDPGTLNGLFTRSGGEAVQRPK